MNDDEVRGADSAGPADARRRRLLHFSLSGAAACAALMFGPSISWAESPTTNASTNVAGTGGKVLLVIGDSLSAEYGLQRGSGWVALLQTRLTEQHLAVKVVNAAISGDTSSGGRSRLPALLKMHHPSIVVIELGGNDALRGLPLAQTRDNLAAMAEAAKAIGAKVVIVGMQVPPNYGRSYGDEFAAMFSAVAKSENTALVPFMLKGVADGPQADAMFQADRIHPVASAHPQILANIWPTLQPLLR